MLDSIKIQNFRSFQEVEISGCKRINVIVGENGSGKTALLEALFLAGGISPELAMRTRSWRGLEGQQMSGSPESLHDALWSDLFYKFQTNKPAFVKLSGKNIENRSVMVQANKPGSVIVEPPKRGQSSSGPIIKRRTSPIEFKWRIDGHSDVIVEPTFQNDRLVFPSVPGEVVKAAFFAANRTSSAEEMTGRFSELSRSFRANDFVKQFRDLYPTIRDISIEVSGGMTALFAEVEGLPKKIPLSLASGGMNKLAAILLGISQQQGGLVIVDEIENGFYYSKLPLVWKALNEFSLNNNCQLFISTHSEECLRALVGVSLNEPDDFCMMRTVSTPQGTTVRVFEGHRFSQAIQDDVELR